MKRRSMLVGAGGVVAAAGLATAASWRSATGSASDYARYAEGLREPLARPPGMADLIRYATLAANSHNTQPWRFVVGSDAIDILPDFSRSTPVVDPDNHHLFVSLGCAAQNLAIAAAAGGLPGTVTVKEDGSLRYSFSRAPPRDEPLLQAIVQRQSTRAVYDGRAVPAQDIETLLGAASAPGVQAIVLTARAEIDQFRDLVVSANEAQMADLAFLKELKAWLRFSPRRAKDLGDGLYAASSGNPVMPEALGRRAFDLFFTRPAENAEYARQMDSSAGVIAWVAEREDPAHWAVVGQAVQRFALTATLLGLKHAFVNQPVEVAHFRSDLAGLLGTPSLRPDILVRFGFGPTLPYSARRPVQSVVG